MGHFGDDVENGRVDPGVSANGKDSLLMSERRDEHPGGDGRTRHGYPIILQQQTAKIWHNLRRNVGVYLLLAGPHRTYLVHISSDIRPLPESRLQLW